MLQVIDPTRLRFLFQKELKNSDVSSLRRMILPKVRFDLTILCNHSNILLIISSKVSIRVCKWLAKLVKKKVNDGFFLYDNGEVCFIRKT